jgi:anti-anti-sigma factor
MDSRLLSDTFVELADTMVADFDVIDFLHTLTDRSVRLLSASAAGVVLADPRGELRVAAASSEAAGLVELFQLQNDQGPCLDCYRTGQPVTAADLAGPGQQWPQFAAAATQAGFRAVQALPMRLRDQVIGALNLFRAAPGLLDPEDLRIGQALADVATIGLLHERNLRRSETVAEQLQGALNSRIIIEQAKGKLAERLGTDMDEAFRVLRAHARDRNQRLTDTARYLIEDPAADFPAPGPPAAGPGRLNVCVAAGESGPVVVLSGEADLTTAAQLSQALTAQISGGARHLTVDLSRLRFADAAAIRALVLASRTLNDRAGTLELVRPQPTVVRALGLLGMDQVFPVRGETGG